MKRIVHISDLHYGRDRPDLEDPLVEAIARIAPDLVAISGDFTQRARRDQFRRAAAFVARIPGPVLAVPGNHDIPLDNIWVRMLSPFGRYRRAIGRDLEPRHTDEEMVVAGVNTVNPYSWQRGRISRRTVSHVCDAFEEAGNRLRVAVLHHPLEHDPAVEKRLMRGALKALGRLEACGADIVLSGHLHATITSPFAAAPGLLFVQAGTVLSDRLRGERNAFNLVEGTRERVTIETWQAESAEAGFAPTDIVTFTRDDDTWTRR